MWARYLMKRWLDRIQIWRGGSLGISDDLITFWEESIKKKQDGRWKTFWKNSHPKNFWVRYLMNHWLDRIQILCSGSLTLPYQVRPSDYQSDLDNRCALQLYEREGVRATWIFIMTSPVYWLYCGGHTQVRLFGLPELAREEGGSELIAHIRDIQESANSRQLDRWRWVL